MKRLTNLKSLLIAAGSVLAAVSIGVIVINKIAPAPQQFAVFRTLQPGEDPLAVAKDMMGTGTYEHHGFFGTDYRLLDNPNLVGLLL